MTQNISPLPWFAKRSGFSTVYIESRIRPGTLQEVAACGPTEGGSEEQDANAAFIVRAVNSHSALVNALKGLLQVCPVSVKAERTEEFSAARAALAAAEAS